LFCIFSCVCSKGESPNLCFMCSLLSFLFPCHICPSPSAFLLFFCLRCIYIYIFTDFVLGGKPITLCRNVCVWRPLCRYVCVCGDHSYVYSILSAHCQVSQSLTKELTHPDRQNDFSRSYFVLNL